MKKILICIICIATIILSVFYMKYINYKSEKNKIKEENLLYENYLDKTFYGTEIATIVNRAIDNNEKNEVKKDENGYYIANDVNSIKVEIKIIDNDTTYQMETIYGGGMTNFVQYYNSIYFKCSKIEYNSAGRVSYVLLEQVTV